MNELHRRTRIIGRKMFTEHCIDCGKVGKRAWMRVHRCDDCYQRAFEEGKIETVTTYSLNGKVVTEEAFEAHRAKGV